LVSIITVTMRPQYMDEVLFNYARQEWEDKELIVVLNKDNMNLNKWKERAKLFDRVRVYQLPEEYPLGRCLNWAIARANSKIIAKFDDDDYYAPYYLSESMKAIQSGKAPIIGKHTAYVYFVKKRALMLYRKGNENRHKKKLKGGTIVFKRTVWDRVKFDEKKVAGSDARWLTECADAGYKAYSVSKENYACIRRGDGNSHTQKRRTKDYMKHCNKICQTGNYVPYVTKKVK
jgi:glycosyltransferase involved in cell wall biosynthesis